MGFRGILEEITEIEQKRKSHEKLHYNITPFTVGSNRS